MAGHTGQSSQLFPVTIARNAWLLTAVARNALSPACQDRWTAELRQRFDVVLLT